jgi:hypothetical protein
MANPLHMRNLADIGQRLGRQSISALRLFLSLGAMMATGTLDVVADSRFQLTLDRDSLLEERIERRLAWDREVDRTLISYPGRLRCSSGTGLRTSKSCSY